MSITAPTPSKWTEDQLKAINEKGKDILVAAAAGSGKTAVLVERIIKKISNPISPVNVDELLVATFTKAAAAEMRERIREALEKEIFQDPDNAHVRRQLALINRASITTLHSFCKDVIKRYYQTIELDPGFRVANEIESSMIRQDVLDSLMEEKYEMMATGDSFWSLVEWFGGERDDTALFRLVQQLYDASRSHLKPDEWLRQMAFQFDGPEAGESWFASLMLDVRLELQSILATLNEALHVATSPSGPLPYVDNLQSELTSVNSLIAASETTWERLYQSLQLNVFDRLKPCKKDAFDEGMIQQVKDYRDAAKKGLEKIKEDLFKRSLEQYRFEFVSMAPIMRELVELVILFAARYQLAKNEKNLVDFSDLEHFCLKVLSEEKEEGVLTPSAAALSYKKQFQEVLLDEYQDTNRVQEAIVTLISRQEPGNRFMVGDVKQSVYRFRLAEPGLFLEKYNRFRKDGSGDGLRIDLAQNFRSRREVIHAANFIFRQIMSERVGEVPYDKDAELIYGANYPEDLSPEMSYNTELLLINRNKGGGSEPSIFDQPGSEDAGEFLQDEAEDLEPARMEAKVVAQEIKKLMGLYDGERFRVFDKKLGDLRPITYRDIVVLMRSPQASSPLFIDELKLQGIPAYAEINTGYFTASEVETMLSLLQVIDNPYQDIPLAAVLRSPLAGLTADDLAKVRSTHRRGDFYEAVVKYVGEELPSDQFPEDMQLSILEAAAEGEVPSVSTAPTVSDELASKLSSFLRQLEAWRTEAREGSLADLIWRIYRDTNFYDFVGGLPGGVQRQANLKGLYDRARQYEATSFRGLFRFLRFISRMKEAGNDLGTAKSIGEQEDVVRLMSIHKSKGLEFPVVFVAGMAKQFNQQDLNGHFLIHKELGFGPKFVDTDLRVSYPSLSSLAIKRKMRMEMLAEEMRVLYVALTRPREKMYLVGAVRNLEKQIQAWSKHILHKGILLPDHDLARATCYLDWIGPALVRHPDASIFRNMTGFGYAEALEDEESKWTIRIIEPSSLVNADVSSLISEVDEVVRNQLIDEVMNHRPIVGVTTAFKADIESRLNWDYPLAVGSTVFSKTSVTELKRIGEINPMMRDSLTEDGWNASTFTAGKKESNIASVASRRPRFMEERKMTPVERGTVYHTVMQNLPLNKGSMTVEDIRGALDTMVNKRLFTADQANAVEIEQIEQFFKQDIGSRILQAKNVMREIPFSYGLSAADIYPDVDGQVADEIILTQGVIDCLFEEEEGLILLDYKTDSTRGKTLNQLIDKYRLQINLYERAIEDTWKRPVIEKYLYFFDGGQLIELK
ncbi:helicase-exonuclease AddAB subunit AddA [Paenibacillus oralis]|uniref:ATP-dependent helicase/nuclease subunit A n=1 Tax=Paenibacillus oralis TaxID=2490856 RepID=A0A3P3T9N6_9BACL|nr:helicase-exonuclease AddAB subunit AddA [Paenibacillus oralis]RRJ54710.1 helicase-exonuclease AddAB subunit AddA [Paenibacillus oralis]